MRRARSLRLLLTSALVAGGMVALAPGASAFNDQVSVLDFRYSSDDLTVTEGDTVVWRWDGEDSHTVTAFDESFDSGVKYPDDDFAVTFDSPGEYAYFCRIHGPQMSGVVNVLPEEGKAVTPASDLNLSEAIAWSQATVPDGGASTVLLGRDDKFPDALASGGPQGKLGAPLLLNGQAALDGRVKAELERVGAGEVVILGGEAAISANVAKELEDAGYVVTRISGAERIQTSVRIAQRFFGTTDQAFLARAHGPGTAAFADSLGAGAAAAKIGAPVLLTLTESLDAGVKSYLDDAGVSTVHIAGGTAAVSKAVEDELTAMGIEVNRLGGADRFETNALIANAVAGGFFDPETVAVVIDGSGDNADAWVSGLAAALSAADHGMLIVSDRGMVHDGYLETLIELDPAVICGPGTAAACDFVVNAASTKAFFEAGNLLAVANTPTAADTEGRRAWLDLRPADDDGTACWATVNGSLSTPVVASHIHKVSDNSAVFDTGAITPGARPNHGCGAEANAGDLAAILADPSAYYWNIHFDDTTETVKGTVTLSGETGFTFGTGEQEVPGPGHPTGVTFSPHWFDANADDVFCIAIQSFIFGASGPVEITGAHIHDGPAGEAGPIVIPLDPPPAGNLVGGGCVDTDDPALVADIRANPNEYYLNLHTEEHPAGAVRGQLIDVMPPHSDPVVVS